MNSEGVAPCFEISPIKSASVWPTTLAHGSVNACFNMFKMFTVTGSPFVLEYLAGETGVLTLIATAAVAGGLLYRLGRQPRVARQAFPRAEANT